MKTKVRLNCYFFSNLIVGLLTLNCLFSNDKVLVEVKKNGGKLEPIYAIVVEEEEKEVKEVKEDIKKEDVKVQSVSVTKKTLASKKVINYVKPSYNSVTGANLVSYAKHYLGLPYISAGRSLERGTDCSGFTRLIYREFGINLGTTVGSQIYSGTYVSKNDLEPGDLVFYGYSTSKATHVAIYIGGGQIIHESTPRDGVKISPVNIMVYVTARRLITKNVVKEEKKEVKPEVKPEEKTEIKEENKDTNSKLEEVVDNKVEEQVTTEKEEEKVNTPVIPSEETKKEEEKIQVETKEKEEVKPEEVVEPKVQEQVIPDSKDKENILDTKPEIKEEKITSNETTLNSSEINKEILESENLELEPENN